MGCGRWDRGRRGGIRNINRRLVRSRWFNLRICVWIGRKIFERERERERKRNPGTKDPETRGRIHDKLLALEWSLVKQPSGTFLSRGSIPWDPTTRLSWALVRIACWPVGNDTNILINILAQSERLAFEQKLLRRLARWSVQVGIVDRRLYNLSLDTLHGEFQGTVVYYDIYNRAYLRSPVIYVTSFLAVTLAR